jgi:hypothetical protein
MTARGWHTLAAGTVLALVVAGVISYFASRNPDGLEATAERLGVVATPESGVAPPASPFKDYGVKWLPEGFSSNAIAGVTGTALVLGILLGMGVLLRRRPAARGAESDRPAT